MVKWRGYELVIIRVMTPFSGANDRCEKEHVCHWWCVFDSVFKRSLCFFSRLHYFLTANRNKITKHINMITKEKLQHNASLCSATESYYQDRPARWLCVGEGSRKAVRNGSALEMKVVMSGMWGTVRDIFFWWKSPIPWSLIPWLKL